MLGETQRFFFATIGVSTADEAFEKSCSEHPGTTFLLLQAATPEGAFEDADSGTSRRGRRNADLGKSRGCGAHAGRQHSQRYLRQLLLPRRFVTQCCVPLLIILKYKSFYILGVVVLIMDNKKKVFFKKNRKKEKLS